MKRQRWLPWISSLGIVPFLLSITTPAGDSTTYPQAAPPSSWPPIRGVSKPWTYWWWMGNAVDEANLRRELVRYRDAGLGGVHIIPIYGAKGWESNYLTYLSPAWMDKLQFTVREARKLGLGVDMTTGSGWCFGGPTVSDQDANASVVAQILNLPAGQHLTNRFNRALLSCLIAFNSQGQSRDLIQHLTSDGPLEWKDDTDSWRVYAISQKPSGQKVKRAAPGGTGHMLNLLYPEAMRRYLDRFDNAFADYHGPLPRAQYHDSYEYRSEWAPDFLVQFEKRRGYRLQDELPTLFGSPTNDRTARVKSDYRETLSDLMVENTVSRWASWARTRGFLTRNEAHGSPGNWLDLYAIADIPETEMFYKDRNLLISKFASSAAHVTGKPLVSSETGTWVREHFTETLADLKYLLDDLYLSGVNHVFYHGTCYSPDEAGWPGWLFYASTQMNPRNPIWRDAPILNAYAARCQSVLQDGQSDNDLLVYWPIHDRWHDARGMAIPFTVHAREWFEQQSIGVTADWLWQHGYAFDYLSDRQLLESRPAHDCIALPGNRYRALVVPACHHLPLPVLEKLLSLAKAGSTLLFDTQLPADVPGLANLDTRRTAFQNLVSELESALHPYRDIRQARWGNGRILVGNLVSTLTHAGLRRESLVDHEGLEFVRRRHPQGHYYFLANRGEQTIDDWISLATDDASAILLDPLSGRAGKAKSRRDSTSTLRIFLQIPPGGSLLVKTTVRPDFTTSSWRYTSYTGNRYPLQGRWQVDFLSGGPELPPSSFLDTLESWTAFSGDASQRFGGTARYSIRFDAPERSQQAWSLDLGRVCQSARIRLNHRNLDPLITAPFRVIVPRLKARNNLLEIEVTSTAANRIRDLDRRGQPWKNFHDINFVGIDYKPFNAAAWPLADCGLLGPVVLQPVQCSLQP